MKKFSLLRKAFFLGILIMKNKYLNNLLFHNPMNLLLYVILTVILIILSFSLLNYFEYFSQKTSEILFNLLQTSITAIAILISAYCASILALENINKSRKNIKLQETLKYIINAELDKEFIKSKNIWSQYKSQEDHDRAFKILFSWHYIWSGDQQKSNKICKSILLKNNSNLNSNIVDEHAQLVMTYFNYFEFISLGIESGIIDEEFYRNWHETHFIRTWNYSVSGIGAIRTTLSNDKLFIHWQKIVEKWAPDNKRPCHTVPDCSIGDLIATLEKQTEDQPVDNK